VGGYPTIRFNANPEENILRRGSDWRWRFFPFWIGQMVSLVGSRVVQFALIWYLAQESGSAIVLSVAALVGLVPEIILGPIAGAYVDRWDRQVIMILADGVVAFSSWILAYLFWVDAVEIGVIYIVLFVRSLGGSFHLPAVQASTSLLVPEKQLTRVNGLNQLANGLLTIAGPPLGALLLSILPYFGILLVDVGSAIVAIGLLMFINVPLPEKPSTPETPQSVVQEIKVGLRYVLGWRGLLILILVSMMTRFLLTPAYTLLPLLISEYFNGTAGQLGLLEGLLGVGMIVGGIVLSLWGGFKRRILTITLGFAILGLGLILFGIAPANLFVIALAGGLIVGVAVPLIDGPLMALFQATVKPDLQGRIFSLLGSLVALATPLGLMLAGPVSEYIGIQIWFWLAGSACILTGISLYFLPDITQLGPTNPTIE
jgi:DHA3 family macrolide efflux protein-like MFS transporter